VAIQIKIPPLSVKAAKKRKKVWIASRHASLAVAMTGAGTAFFNSLLEPPQRHFLDAVVLALAQNEVGARAGGKDILPQIWQVDPVP